MRDAGISTTAHRPRHRLWSAWPALLLCAPGAPAKPAGPRLALSARLPGTATRKACWVRVLVKNVRDGPVYVHPSFGLLQPGHPAVPLKLRLTRVSGGEAIPYSGHRVRIGTLYDKDLVRLSPRCLYGADLNLAASYRLPAGMVEVSLRYDTRRISRSFVAGRRLWRGATAEVRLLLEVR